MAFKAAWLRTRSTIVLLLCGVLFTTSYSQLGLKVASYFPSTYSFCFIVVFFIALLPNRGFILAFPLALAVLRVFHYLNEWKIAAVALPITFFDVRMFIREPTVISNAAGIDNRVYGVSIFLVSAVCVLVVVLWSRRRAGDHLEPVRHSRVESFARLASSFVNLTCVGIVLVAGHMTLARYGKSVHTNLRTVEERLWRDLWLPSAQVELSRKLGVLEYVAFSSFAARADVAIAPQSGLKLDRAALKAMGAKFVSVPPNASQKMLPNLVIFHAESAFDPNAAFKLSSHLSLPLWSDLQETEARGPLRVNIVGGGSWVTEFEVLTGVDSRLFGFEGFYTHYYIAPRVKNSFVKYAARKGYRTVAFYPIDGTFYNAAKAFASYGFAEFIDGVALRLPSRWVDLVDRDIVDAALKHSSFEQSGPFLYFVSTSENHGPHPCKHFESERELMTTFALPVSFDQNCQLNEYLRRARSTSEAFQAVLQELREIEELTGRAFVLLAYGDHQPWSFTEGVYSIGGGTAAEPGFGRFSAVRTSADKNETFFHILTSGSLRGIVKKDSFKTPLPVALLPSLASAYLAASGDDLYMPENFFAFDACGSDLFSATCAERAELAPLLRAALTMEPGQTSPKQH